MIRLLRTHGTLSERYAYVTNGPLLSPRITPTSIVLRSRSGYFKRAFSVSRLVLNGLDSGVSSPLIYRKSKHYALILGMQRYSTGVWQGLVQLRPSQRNIKGSAMMIDCDKNMVVHLLRNWRPNRLRPQGFRLANEQPRLITIQNGICPLCPEP
jgi:hypothetical protein